MTTGSEWVGKVGNSWASEWQRTDRSFRDLTRQLLAVAQAQEFAHALDVGCGAGEIALRLAEGNPVRRITGIDLSQDLVAVASQRTDHLANVCIELSDAGTWTAPTDARPDLLVSRHGVMFFPEPVAAFTHLRQQLVPGARLAFSCFRERHENEWVSALATALPPPAAPIDPRTPGPFAFGESAYVKSILIASGWQDVAFEQIDYPMVAGQGDNALEDALSYFLRIGTAARAIAEMDASERPATVVRLRELLSGYLHGDTLALPASCWIVTAHADG